MANTIYTAQNRLEILLQLVAQRRLYSRSKCFDLANLWLTNLGALLAVLFSCSYIGGGDELFLSFVLLVPALVVRYQRIACKAKAARVQQFIDTTLYSEQVGCERKTWGDCLTETDVAGEIAGYTDRDVQIEGVENWYPNFSSLDPEQAVLMCQKTNIGWDADLRKGYFFVNVVAFLLVLVVAWMICRRCNSFSMAVCFVPAMLYWAESLSAYFFDRLRAQKMATLAEEAEHQINDDGRATVLPTLIRLQKVIFENRENSFLVPDWYYRLRRNALQKRADSLANSID